MSLDTLVEDARCFATQAHASQVRKYTGLPYINHPREVATIVQEAGLPPEAVAAAWLHDVVEDCGVTLTTIEHEFGRVVAILVRDLTNCEKSVGNRAKRNQIDRDRLAAACPHAQTIKAADIKVNTRDIVEEDPDYAPKYLVEKRAQLEVLTRADLDVLTDAWQTLLDSEAKLSLVSQI